MQIGMDFDPSILMSNLELALELYERSELERMLNKDDLFEKWLKDPMHGTAKKARELGLITEEELVGIIEDLAETDPDKAFLLLIKQDIDEDYKRRKIQDLRFFVPERYQIEEFEKWIDYITEDKDFQKQIAQELIENTQSLLFVRDYSPHRESWLRDFFSEAEIKELVRNKALEGADVFGYLGKIQEIFEEEEFNEIVKESARKNPIQFWHGIDKLDHIFQEGEIAEMFKHSVEENDSIRRSALYNLRKLKPYLSEEEIGDFLSKSMERHSSYMLQMYSDMIDLYPEDRAEILTASLVRNNPAEAIRKVKSIPSSSVKNQYPYFT